MTPAEHRAKAGRIGRSLGRCTPADYESVVEGAMLEACHWINAALHALGATAPAKDFMHPYFITPEERRDYDRILGPEVLRAYEEIEDYRPFFVRGADAGGDKIAARALELLALIRDKTRRLAPG